MRAEIERLRAEERARQAELERRARAALAKRRRALAAADEARQSPPPRDHAAAAVATQSPQTGDVVKISSLNEPYRIANWVGARRIL